MLVQTVVHACHRMSAVFWSSYAGRLECRGHTCRTRLEERPFCAGPCCQPIQNAYLQVVRGSINIWSIGLFVHIFLAHFCKAHQYMQSGNDGRFRPCAKEFQPKFHLSFRQASLSFSGMKTLICMGFELDIHRARFLRFTHRMKGSNRCLFSRTSWSNWHKNSHHLPRARVAHAYGLYTTCYPWFPSENSTN